MGANEKGGVSTWYTGISSRLVNKTLQIISKIRRVNVHLTFYKANNINCLHRSGFNSGEV